MKTSEIKTGRYNHQYTEAKPEHVVEEFDNGKTVRCADRTLWKFDPAAKVWRRVYTLTPKDQTKYNGRRDYRSPYALPDDHPARAKTPEYTEAIKRAKVAREQYEKVRGEWLQLLRKLDAMRTTETPDAKKERLRNAMEANVFAAREELDAAQKAELEQRSIRARRIREAEREILDAVAERNRKHRAQASEPNRKATESELQELLSGSK